MTEITQENFEKWRRARSTSVVGPVGNLALRETRWLTENETLTVAEAAKTEPPTVTVTSVEQVNLLTSVKERGLRFWDSQSEAIKNFQGISTFDFDPAWVLTGTFQRAPEDRTVPFEHLRDNGLARELAVPGDIHVAIHGKQYNLSAFDDDGTLLLAFGDLTNSHSDLSVRTYSPGRFLSVYWVPGSDSIRGGEVILDFNRAFIPPCGFSDAYNCPLPPQQNRIDVEIRAGEIRILTSLPPAH
jgi:uncharacterized protein (DUF1684 family)